MRVESLMKGKRNGNVVAFNRSDESDGRTRGWRSRRMRRRKVREG